MTREDQDLAEMKRQLATARQQSVSYVHGDALPAGDAVRALVARDVEATWGALSDDERFFLYEISPDARRRAQPAELARAYCAGLRAVSAEWWGIPGTTANEVAARLVALGASAAACLRPLLDTTSPLRYHDGEANALVRHHGWIAGDLAAGLGAALLGQTFDAMQPPDARARRRAELAQALDAMARSR